MGLKDLIARYERGEDGGPDLSWVEDLRRQVERDREERERDDEGYLAKWRRKVGRVATREMADMGALSVKALSALRPGGRPKDDSILGSYLQVAEPISQMASHVTSERDRLATEDLAETSLDVPTPIATAGFWSAETAGMLLDPSELLPGGMVADTAMDVARGVRRAGSLGKVVGSSVDDAFSELSQEAGKRAARSAPTPPPPAAPSSAVAASPAGKIGKEGKFRPPDQPFQYNAGRHTELPESALLDIEEAMSTEKVLDRRRTGIGIDYANEAKDAVVKKVGLSERDFINAPPGTVYNREENYALDILTERVGMEREALRPLIAEGTATAAEISRFEDLTVRWSDLLAASMAASSEAGRTLQSYQRLRQVLDSPASVKAHLAKKFGKRMSDADKDLLAKIDLDDPEQLGDFLLKMNRPKWWEYPREMFYSSILSGLGTHGRNAVGNALHSASAIPVRAGAAAVDATISKLVGRERTRYMQEVVPYAVGLVEGAQDGFQRMRAAWRAYGDWVPDAQKFEVPRGAFRRAPNKFVRESVAPVVELPFRALAAVDELFKGISHGGELRALAIRSGVDAGLEGQELTRHVSDFLQDPPKEALEKAVQHEQMMTFTNDLGEAGQALQKFIAKVPIINWIVPFVKTPINLFKRGAEFTPLNTPRAALMVYKGDEAAADNVAKTLIGSATMAWGFMKAAQGELRGPPPRDPGDRDAFFHQGKTPFSIRMGGYWVPFGQVEPLAMPLAMVAAAHEGYMNGEGEGTSFERAQAALALLLANQLDRSYLEGLADLADLRSAGAKSFSEKGTALVGRQAAATAIPLSGAMRNVANLIDGRIVDKTGIGDYLQEPIPHLKAQLPGRLGRFGDEIKKTWWEAIGPTGTPAVPVKATEDRIELALEELGLRVGFPSQSISGIKLDRDEYRAYLAHVGPRTKLAIASVLHDPSFREFPQEQQQAALDRIVSATRDAAKAEALFGAIPGVPPLAAKKELAAVADRWATDYKQMRRDLRAGASTGQPASKRLADLAEARSGWDERWGTLSESVSAARRRGLSDESIRRFLVGRGIPEAGVKALLRGKSWTFPYGR